MCSQLIVRLAMLVGECEIYNINFRPVLQIETTLRETLDSERAIFLVAP